MKYNVITSESLLDLMEEIDKRINAGWKLVGGVAVAKSPVDSSFVEESFSQSIWAQAIILDEST